MRSFLKRTSSAYISPKKKVVICGIGFNELIKKLFTYSVSPEYFLREFVEQLRK